jgi:uncharacterized protein
MTRECVTSLLRNNIIPVFLSGIIALSLGACQRNKSILTNRVLDSAHMLTDAEERGLFNLIQKTEDSTGIQIAVLTVKSINGKNINSYASQIVDNIELGGSKHEYSVLITFVNADRNSTFEIGDGLKKTFTKKLISEIFSDMMWEIRKNNQTYVGFYNAIMAIKERVTYKKKSIDTVSA